jgi:hypothetical protein
MDSRQTKKLTFHETAKANNGRRSAIQRYFPSNANNAEAQEYRRSALKTFPAPSYPYAKLRSDLAPYAAQIMAKNVSTMEELEHEVYTLLQHPVDREAVLNRMKFLYGNNLPSTTSNEIDMAITRAKRQRAEQLARLRGEAKRRSVVAATPTEEENLSARLAQLSLQSPNRSHTGGRRTRRARRRA